MDRFTLDGRTALITGGAGLLGREHALALLERGARVVVTDVDESALSRLAEHADFKKSADRLVIRVMDVVSRESIEAVAADLAGAVNVLVNNAAVDPKVEPASAGQQGSVLEESRFENFSLEQWDFQMGVGLTGAFLCSQIFGGAMASGEGGVILNIASDLAVIAPDQRLYRKKGVADDQQPVKPVTYSVIKTGLIGLTRYLATYWADRGVRVNAISPGGVYNDQPGEFVQELGLRIPMGRMADKDEYRAAVQFLCSDASSYMTGQNLVIDGGRSVW